MVDEYEDVDRTMEQCLAQSMQAGAGGEAKAEEVAEAKETKREEGENVISEMVSVSDKLVSDEDRCVGTDALEAAVAALINATDAAAAAALDKFEGWEPHHFE